jgi:hypothetical protein
MAQSYSNKYSLQEILLSTTVFELQQSSSRDGNIGPQTLLNIVPTPCLYRFWKMFIFTMFVGHTTLIAD